MIPENIVIRNGQLHCSNGEKLQECLKAWQKENSIPDGTFVNVAHHDDLCRLQSDASLIRGWAC